MIAVLVCTTRTIVSLEKRFILVHSLRMWSITVEKARKQETADYIVSTVRRREKSSALFLLSSLLDLRPRSGAGHL